MYEIFKVPLGIREGTNIKILPIRLTEEVEQEKENSRKIPFMLKYIRLEREKVLKWHTMYNSYNKS